MTVTEIRYRSMAVTDTHVLVVGSGPAGASTALFLARHGLDVTLVTRSTWVADSPRAHITNARTMEVLRSVGMEAACRAQATSAENMANHILCTTLAGEEFGRVWSWGNDPARAGEYCTTSPVRGCDLPQDRLEPVLLAEAARCGVRLRFQTKLLGLEEGKDKVTVQLSDRLTGGEVTITASYVVGADGGQSRVAEAIGLPFEGKSGVGNAMNVRFTADLSRHVAHRPGSLYEVIQPDRVDGLGHAMLRMVHPWYDWVVGFVHLGERNAYLTVDEAEQEIHKLIGDDTVDVEVTGLYPWRINHVVARRYQTRRVLCAGDAVHRHPPMNGLGANTCIQDGYNLAWKLAYVVAGRAGPRLLDSYTAERQPVGEQIVDRAIASWHQGMDVLSTLGLDAEAPASERAEQFAVLGRHDDAGEARRDAFAAVLDAKAYQFEAHGVEMNQRYASSAIIGNGADGGFDRDPELYVQQTSRPGARVPHCWVGSADHTISTLDLTDPEGFTLLTRTRGDTWVQAAEKVSSELGISITAYRIGFGGDLTDLYRDFARRSEIGEDGCLLIRPDQHVAWRQTGPVQEPAAALRGALMNILDRDGVKD